MTIENTQISQKKRLLLIAPFGNIPNYWLPMSLGYLKSNLPPDLYEIKILDCTFHELPATDPEFRRQVDEFKPDVVGVTTMSPTYPESQEIFKICKSLNNKIVTLLGGAHPSVYPNEAMKSPHTDFIISGEGEFALTQFLEQLWSTQPDFSKVKGLSYRKNGQIIRNEIYIEENLDKIKIPDYEAIGLRQYLDKGYRYGGFFGKNAPIWITRGCPYRCTFCSATLLNGSKVRTHSVKYVIDWITYLYQKFDIRQFNIIDDNFTFHISYAKEFCKEIIRLNEIKYFPERIYFSTPNGIRMQRVDDELLMLMKKAGWTDLTVAPESGSVKTLKRMGKGLSPEIVPDIVKRIKKAGFSVRGFFIVGFPGETREDIRDTVRLIRKCKLDFFTLGRFFPIPGTPIFNELVQTGEINPSYIPDYAYSLLVPSEELKKIYTPKGLENFNFFWLTIREYLLLILRNPYTIIWLLKFYGFSRVLKIIFFVQQRKKDTKSNNQPATVVKI